MAHLHVYTIAIWLKHSKLTVDACTQAEWKLLRSSFKAWRDDAGSTRLEKRIDRRIVAQSFRLWVIQQRSKLLARVRDQSFLQEALEIWKERWREIQDALNSTLEISERSRAMKILGTSLTLWQETLAIRRQEYDLAIVKFHMPLLLTVQDTFTEIYLSKVVEALETVP
jgi:hypothetical protein